MVGLSLFIVPVICSASAHDAFRYPKLLVFRGTAILIAAIFVTAAIWNGVRWRALIRDRAVPILGASIVLWSVIATLLSTNRMLSVRALEYTLEALLFFCAASVAVTGRRAGQVMIAPMAAGIVNSLLAISQATNWWNPFPFDQTLAIHLRTSALLGNPNDVGDYVMLLAIAGIAMAIVEKKRRWWVTTGVLIAGLVASQSLGAIISFIAGLLVLAFLASRRAGWIVISSVVLATLVAFVVLPTLRARAAFTARALSEDDWSAAMSQRDYPFSAAWEMFKDHPLTGVGPGAFKFQFLDYRMRVTERHPDWLFTAVQNYAEAHSDHLQLLAEEGLPGWLLFIAALALVARATFRHWHRGLGKGDGDPESFAHYAGAPFAVAFGTVALASFPLEMVAVMQLAIYLAAIILNWSSQP